MLRPRPRTTATSTTQISQNGQVMEEDQQQIPVPNTAETVDKGDVTVSGGYTLNLGNYQSARVDVSVRLPANPINRPTDEQINAAYERASSFVGDFITAQASSVIENGSPTSPTQNNTENHAVDITDFLPNN